LIQHRPTAAFSLHTAAAAVAVAAGAAFDPYAGEPVQLWPGDELSWSCTFNTSTTNRTVLGNAVFETSTDAL
jgi:hypothetical protein